MFLCLIFRFSLSATTEEKIKFLNLPTWSKAWKDPESKESEITIDEINKAFNTFHSNLNPKSFLIISMRKETLEEQYSHFIFGAALAYALNRSIKIEMRNYPLSKAQPTFKFEFNGITPGLVEVEKFRRLRISREFYCKTEQELKGDPNIPILLRNYDEITTIYGNHFLSSRMKELFGMHAAYFLSNYYLKQNEVNVKADSIGIDARSFGSVRKNKFYKDPKKITKYFNQSIAALDKDKKLNIYIVSNNTQIATTLQSVLWNSKIVDDDATGFWTLVGCKTFVGTYRSRNSNAVQMTRGVAGYLVSTSFGECKQMSNSQSGILSPYLQNVEDVEYTTNEKIRGCRDNIDEIRELLDIFIL